MERTFTIPANTFKKGDKVEIILRDKELFVIITRKESETNTRI
jgi:hypothetical protein